MEPSGFRYGNLRQVTRNKLVLTCHGVGAVVQCRLQIRMAAPGVVVLRQRFCRNGACRAVFFLCPSCDRGQRYCGLGCRQHARLHQRRRANRRHQQSLEGQLDHRDRQRRYRRRRMQASVTDQGSLLMAGPPSFRNGRLEISTPRQTATASLPRWPPRQPGVRICCQVCGRQGGFLDPFPPSP